MKKQDISALLFTIGLFLVLSAFPAHAQNCNFSIRGKVIHLENNQSIPGAYIWIEEVKNGAITDDDGNFIIRDLCAGTYTLKIQFLGHKEIIETITLEKGSFNKTYRLEEDSMELEGVEIHGHQDAIQTTTAIQALYGEELLESRGENLGESLKRVAGVTTFSTGNSIAKPVIHGLHSNRIMILNNGIRLEGQQWGAEHARKLTPFWQMRSR
ncbi:carboxypeptidase-like regulatory domain-containing protein [Algoriphagus hitonicola]|uniref:carboxypeptidase-like regulatory domain-containing protein n=1 Tax=Algoriphagus hitonicola TaxID=435880 RepID=UPI00361136C3